VARGTGAREAVPDDLAGFIVWPGDFKYSFWLCKRLMISPVFKSVMVLKACGWPAYMSMRILVPLIFIAATSL